MRVILKVYHDCGSDISTVEFDLDDLVRTLNAGGTFEVKAMCDDLHSRRLGLRYSLGHENHTGKFVVVPRKS